MALGTNAPSPLTTPTHDGSGEAIHPSVVDAVEITGANWNGHRYWMAMTPYPNTNDDFENPSILVSDDKTTWTVPSGLTNPVVPEPTGRAGGHNSDTDLLLEPDGSLLHMFYRESAVGGSNNQEERIFLTSSSDGVTWSTPTQIIATGNTTDKGLFLSPASLKAGGIYHLYGVRSAGRGVDYRTATSVSGPWSSGTILDASAIGGLEPWHMACRLEKNGAVRFTVHATADGQADGGEIWLAESPGPGKNITGIDSILGPSTGWDTKLYRGCMIPLPTLGDYGLYYSANDDANTWRTGYIEFSGPAPLYADSEPTTSRTISDVDAGETYEVRVQAENAAGAGPFSAWQTVGGGGITGTADHQAQANDSWSALCAASTSTTATATASDSLSVIANINTSIISAAQASDTSGDSSAATVSLDSAATGSDSVDALASAAAALSAGAAAGESWTVQAQVVANMLDQAAASDQIARATENAINAALSEGSAASDQFIAAINALCSIQDSATADDAFIAAVVTIAGISSGAIASDSFGVNFGQIKNIESGAISSDAWAMLASLTASLSEVCTAQDIMSAQADTAAAVTFGAVVTGTFAVVNQGIQYLVMGAITLRAALNQTVTIKP